MVKIAEAQTNYKTNTDFRNGDNMSIDMLFVSAFRVTGLRVGRPQTSSSPPVILLLAVPRRLFCFGSLVVLDVVFRYLSLCLLYINIKIGKNRCLMLD